MIKRKNNYTQIGGEGSTNYQASGDVTVNNGISQADLEKLLKSITIDKDTGDDLIVNHYVCESFSNLYEIAARDYRSFPLTNVRFLNNNVTRALSNIMNYHNRPERDEVVESESYSSVEEYCSKYKEVIFPRGSSSPFQYYEVMRELSASELQHLSKKDGLLKIMLAHKLHEQCCIAKSVGYEHGCWGIPLLEEFIVRRLWGVFTAITNIGDRSIVMNSIDCDYRSSDGFLRMDAESKSERIDIPPIPLAPNTTLVVPIALVLPPIGPITRKNLSSYCGEDGERVQILQHGSISIDSNDTFILGDSLKINAINYKKGGLELTSPVHCLDFNNLLSFDMHWQIGSCPHLFIRDGELKYVREILANCQNTIGVDTFVVKGSIQELIVCELEDEATLFESIHINEQEFISNIRLNKGQSIVIPVNEGDLVVFKGQYVPYGLPESQGSQSLKRAEIINQFTSAQYA